MYKKFSYILIPIIALGILLAPISPVFEKHDKNLAFEFNLNKAKAANAITVSISNSSLKVGDTETVGIIVSGGEEIDVTLTVPDNDLDGKTCTTTASGDNTVSTCSFTFTAAKEGTFSIAASTTDKDANGADYSAGQSSITVAAQDPNADNNSDKTALDSNKQSWTNDGFGCGLFDGGRGVAGCFIYLLYHMLWTVSAEIARLAGYFLDFFVYYSTNSSSYTNEFINQGFAAIRDIANIFFIIALLFVAIKTILDLNVTNNKKIIGTIVVMALLINFSLFFTQVVIDGSNILAKVFYNQIGSKSESGDENSSGAGGQTSISIGLVDKFDPQTVMTREQYWGTGNGDNSNQGAFVFLIILTTAVTLYAAFIFFSVGILFVGRVVTLWIAMIFAPLAFASRTIPDMNIPGIGWKEWWNDLLKNSFLAPIFIFFLYLIVIFADFLKTIGTTLYNTGSSTDAMQMIMGMIIPFAILMILLMKAKGIAVKMSGEMGAMMSKIGSTVGGLALGAATGGAAMLGRRVIGGGGSYLAGKLAKKAADSGNVKTAQRLRDFSNYAQKSSFDLRKVSVAGKNLGSVTGLNVGKGGGGSWGEMKKKQDEKRMKRADALKKGGTGAEKKALAESEIALKEAVLSDVSATVAGKTETLPIKLHLENLDKEMDRARKELNDAKLSDPDDGSAASVAAKAQMASAKADLDAAKAEKDRIRSMGSRASGGSGSIKDLEGDKNKASTNLEVKEDKIVTAYAEKISSTKNKVKNVIFRAGGYSVNGADETARNLKSGKKVDSGEKPH